MLVNTITHEWIVLKFSMRKLLPILRTLYIRVFRQFTFLFKENKKKSFSLFWDVGLPKYTYTYCLTPKLV